MYWRAGAHLFGVHGAEGGRGVPALAALTVARTVARRVGRRVGLLHIALCCRFGAPHWAPLVAVPGEVCGRVNDFHKLAARLLLLVNRLRGTGFDLRRELERKHQITPARRPQNTLSREGC